ncbi:MAG TPA: prepilin-type N-terminal cleavage/methylation domain-containing protein [Verrucomicrobiae bacterium]|nr:prepilin-type N-terminal cleavage/methylation domain-containing protein [Verrucomicrobiae bacterium]
MIVRQNIRGAFTLIELMVVITIIAVIAGVMAIEMRGTYEDALLRTNARKLIDVCDAASNRAIAIRQAQVLRINATSGKFVVEPKSKGSEGTGEEVMEGELDTRVSLAIREPARGEEEAEPIEPAAATDNVTFYPDGSADAREFLFRDRTGVELALRINPTTSRVRVIEMAAP